MRMVAWFVVGLVTNAVALFIAATVLDGFDIDTIAFPVVVLIFTLVGAVASPVVEAFIEKNLQLLASLVGLIVAFITLLVTDVITPDLEVSGVVTWILASVIVWAGGLLTGLLVGKWLFRRIAGRPAV